MLKRRRRLTVLAVIGFCLVTAGGLTAIGKVPGLGRVKVTVHNVDATETLHAVTVHVTGASYVIGDLPPGKHASIRVNARGESDVRVRHVMSDGTVVESRVDCYIESGARGSVRAAVNATGLTHADINVRL